MRSDELVDQYWEIVRRSLTDLLSVRSDVAEARIASVRAVVDRGTRRRLPLFYHAEPFYVAYDLLLPEELRALSESDVPPTADEILDGCSDEYARIRDEDDHPSRTAEANGQPTAAKAARRRRPVAR